MKILTIPWWTQTRQARDKLNNEGQIPEGLLRDHIERSWQRCVGQGLDPSRLSHLDPVGRRELKEVQERNLALLSEARALIESLHEQIAGSGSMVILTDPAGLIIHSLGDPEFISKAQRVALKPGVSWAEGARGTNAIGTAAVEQAPVVVHGGEHFLERNAFLTCSAAPIFDPAGRLAGVLDISGDQRSYHKHTLALVHRTAKMIERRLVLSQHGSELLVHLHRIPEFAGTLCEGVMAFSEAGRTLGIRVLDHVVVAQGGYVSLMESPSSRPSSACHASACSTRWSPRAPPACRGAPRACSSALPSMAWRRPTR